MRKDGGRKKGQGFGGSYGHKGREFSGGKERGSRLVDATTKEKKKS